jgi:hypothetical protein
LKPPADLAAFSKEHLCYEINCLYAGVALHLGCSTAANDAFSLTLKNLLLEGVLLHSRCLYEFLYRDSRRYADDAIAADFFASPNHWTEKRPAPSPALAELSGRAGKEVAHLSYKRLDVIQEKKHWNVLQISAELLHVLRLFVEAAPHETVSQSTRDTVNHWKSFTGFNSIDLIPKGSTATPIFSKTK